VPIASQTKLKNVMSWTLWVRFPAVLDFYFLHSVHTDSEVHPASYLMVPEALSPGVKRSVREADRSPPSNAEVKNNEAILPLPHMPYWHSV
jgi:hypothetical protein